MDLDVVALNQAIKAESQFIKRMREEIAKLIVGQEEMVNGILMGLLTGGHVLLEGVPEGIELREVETSLLGIDGVAEVHDLHVWSMTSGRNSLTAHLRLVRDCDAERVMRMATEAVAQRFNITHTTIQTEQEEPCLSDDCGKVDDPDKERNHAEGGAKQH